MIRPSACALLCMWLPTMAAGVTAAQPGRMTEDKGHVYTWNRFTDELYALHLEQLTEYQAVRDVTLGGYANRPDVYRQEKFTDAMTGRLLSVVQWERANPANIHSIAVYRYDDQGRLLRDYSSTYLPDYRNAPTQTLVFLHRYNGNLHAWRSFDATRDLLGEYCEGELNGDRVKINLDIDEIEQGRAERYQHGTGILTTPAYRQCFEHMPETPDDALPPH